MSKRLTLVLILSLLFSFVVSCSKKSTSSKSKVEDNGLTQEINDFVPDSLLKILDSLGMPIYRGENPPNVEGAYLSTPFKLLASNRSGDAIGSYYADYYVSFSEQNNSNLTISVDYVNGPENGTGIGGFIVGGNNSFSVFSELTVVVFADTAYILNLISGTINADGIDDFHLALFMLDNLGNPSGYYINDGEGRVFQDEDGMSEKIDGLPTKYAKQKGIIEKTVSTIRK
jgi:hypothetical protein